MGKALAILATLAFTVLLFVYLLGTGERIPRLLELVPGLSAETPVILIGRTPAFVDNETEFTVGERLYFRLKTEGFTPQNVFWRLQNHHVQRGIAFDTSELTDLDLEALELRAYPNRLTRRLCYRLPMP